jgi:WD40 repeat protein
VATLRGHTDFVCTVLELFDGRVVSGSWDNTLRVWDVATGACWQTLGQHREDTPGLARMVGRPRGLAQLPDGRLVSSHNDAGVNAGGLRVWG